MKNNNKGFTLIELLVVVAIIGILAAVGTVAYTGYTKSAKKNASSSNHASVVKYIAGDAMDCSDKTTDTATAATAALADFKNPYAPTSLAVSSNDTEGTASAAAGNTVISQSTTEVTVSTCTVTDCADGDIKSNVVSIE